MKFSLLFTGLFVSSIAFIGCGGGSSSSSSNSNSLTTSAVTTKTVCDFARQTVDSTIIDLKYAAEGDITAECKTQDSYTYAEFSLVEGVGSMTVTQLIKVENAAGTITEGSKTVSGSSTDTYNYQAGTIHHKIDITGEKYDCIETFPSPLPITITDKHNIEDLFDWDGDENNRISTTCPASYVRCWTSSTYSIIFIPIPVK